MRSCKSLGALVTITSLVLQAGSFAQQPANARKAAPWKDNDIQALEPAKPLERELGGGEAHSYQLTLAAGQFCKIIVEQRGIDVIVAFYSPDGGKTVEVDSPNGADGPELIVLVAEGAGPYRLEIRSPNKNATAGRYEATMQALRAPTPQDKSLLAAQQAFTDAKTLLDQRTAEAQRRAAEKYWEALAVWQSFGERHMAAYTLNELGLIYGDLSEYQKALDAYLQARVAYQQIGDVRGQAGVLNNLGWVYGALGDPRKAINFYEQVLEISRAIGDRSDEPRYLNNIAAEYGALGKYQKALEIHLQVLSLRQARKDLGGQAITLNNIANCYERLGERKKALDYYGQALTLMPAVGQAFYTATTINNIGALYLDMGEHQKALDYFSQALQLRRTIGDRNGEAATLSLLARLERDRGNLNEARNRIEAALAAVESLRANVASQQLRASFFASVRKYHDFHIDLLMRLHKQRPSEGFDALAMQASEKARARSLLELLAEARAEIRQGADPSLLERERSLRQSIGEKAERQTRLLGGKHSAEQATAAAKEIDALATEYEQVQARIRQTSARYAALTQPTPLSLKEIQTEALDPDTLLLEYALGEEKSYLWAVTPTSLKSFELPKRAEIEGVARQVYDALNARNQSLPNEKPEQRQQRLEQADVEYSKASATLSQMLLGPVASELRNKRLLVVSDGMLQYVPFAALPVAGCQLPEDGKNTISNRQPTTGNRQPLIVDHEIVSLPSASVALALRRQTAGRNPASKMLAVLADPVFSKDDPRIALSGKSRAAIGETSSITDAKRSAEEAGLADLVRLRFSRLEADEIARLAADEMKLEALDFRASRSLATSDEIGQYRLIHFATHGLVNSLHPELSGIVLSLVDEEGRPQNGFLRLYDIYNLKLRADLVVLSACQTALGKEVKGEGLVGLTRGFMYAGAPRVVASLWRIDDRASAELMKRFYQEMLGEELRPAAALRAAQVSMWKDKRWQAPHYWAAFTFQGEWK